MAQSKQIFTSLEISKAFAALKIVGFNNNTAYIMATGGVGGMSANTVSAQASKYDNSKEVKKYKQEILQSFKAKARLKSDSGKIRDKDAIIARLNNLLDSGVGVGEEINITKQLIDLEGMKDEVSNSLLLPQIFIPARGKCSECDFMRDSLKED